jgi:nucleoside-diphosphate kinase
MQMFWLDRPTAE